MAEGLLTNLIPDVSGQSMLNGILIGLVVIVALSALAYAFIWWNKKRKYGEYKVVIWEKDSVGNLHETYDSAGTFLDKQTGYKLCFFRKIKKGLNPNKLPFVTSKTSKGKLQKVLYLEKHGVSNYKLLHIKLTTDGLAIKVGEEDINWAAQDLMKVRQMFNKEGFLSKYGPYLAFIITIMIVMIILISLFNKFEVLEKVAANLQNVADRQLEITKELKNFTVNNIPNNDGINEIITPTGVNSR